MNQIDLHERAVSYGYAVSGGSLERGYVQDGYEKGATDQQEIDIQRARDWLEQNLFQYQWPTNSQYKRDTDKEKLLLNLKQAMKGE